MRQNTLIRSLWWLELKDCNENRHEGGYGRSLRNGIVGFGITRPGCVIEDFTVGQLESALDGNCKKYALYYELKINREGCSVDETGTRMQHF